jgi:anthraniloyl-CoA monooxygenase
MRIAVLGGGPGGLYSALLLKKPRPERDVVLYEANPPGATYGWGVVFSDRTLTSFREADLETYRAITEEFVQWDAIDVLYRGRRLHSGGHVFAGIGRRALLRILGDRCDELGVELRWSTSTHVSELTDFDVVLAADGVHSATRSYFESTFRPRLATGKTRYIWFGTTRPFGAFTFIFKTGDDGLFQAHAYPFDGRTSTFIVECDEHVWERAGLDEAGEAESIAYCEKLFGDELRGHSLMSNRSKWVSFVTVKNKSWCHHNVVLLGDAAHTAHFTIGSGTKLAMEDAIALATAVDNHDDVEAALADYELERRPIIERFQAAAAESQNYFETTSNYLHLDPQQFAFYLLTRSGRIDYGSLRLRDPYFVDDVDRWFAQAQSGRPSKVAPPPMFTPLKLRSVTVTNRTALSPPPRYLCDDGNPSSEYVDDLVNAARAGPGLVITEAVAVSASGRVTPGDPGLYREAHAQTWADAAEQIRAETTAKLCLRLAHAGRRGSVEVPIRAVGVPLRSGAWPLLGPSAVPYGPTSPVPREMDRGDMDSVIESFVAAADMAADAGVDIIQIHMGHGYLLGSFLSPLSNLRSDAYGGTRANRLRFPLEVLERVRSAWPSDRPLAVALNADDWSSGGTTVEDAIEFVSAFKDGGCDLVEVLAGQAQAACRPSYTSAFLAPYSDRIRNGNGISTLISGNITTTVQINTLVAAGRADICVLETGRLGERYTAAGARPERSRSSAVTHPPSTSMLTRKTT